MRLAACLSALLISAPACAQIRSVSLAPPARAVGFLVGDKLAATATIVVAPGTTLDPASLPAAGPVTPTLDIRGVGVGFASSVPGDRYTIRIAYQNFATPDHVSSVDVPAYTLVFRQSGARLTAAVPGFSFIASPIQDANLAVVDAAALQPDHPAALMDDALPARIAAIGGAMVVMAGCALAALYGLVAWPWRRAGPFAVARRAIRRGATGDREVFLLLHRAFDETAGTRVFAEDLEGFFARHPRYGDLRGDIEIFFAASRNMFFGAKDAASPLPSHLARDLARAERRR